MQQDQVWPIYYQSGREALQRSGVFKESGHIVQDYFRYRELIRGDPALGQRPGSHKATGVKSILMVDRSARVRDDQSGQHRINAF
jgi:hypothetical protein